MTTPVIIDLIAAVILAGFTFAGARRGLFRTLAGLLIVVAAMVGARWVAETVSPAAAELLAPAVERRIQRELDAALPEVELLPEEDGDAAGLDARELLGLLGIRERDLDELAEKARESIRETGASALTAAAMSVAESVLYSVLYLLSFVVLTVALRLACKALDLMMKLPVLHSANALCGGIAGALEGLLVILVLTVLLRSLGLLPEGSWLTRIGETIHLL